MYIFDNVVILSSMWYVLRFEHAHGIKRYNDGRMTRGQTTCSPRGTASLGLFYLISFLQFLLPFSQKRLLLRWIIFEFFNKLLVRSTQQRNLVDSRFSQIPRSDLEICCKCRLFHFLFSFRKERLQKKASNFSLLYQQIVEKKAMRIKKMTSLGVLS